MSGEKPRDMLDRWAVTRSDRTLLEDFLEWLSQQRIEPCVWTEEARWPVPLVERQEMLLNRYFEIDYKRLEEQRRGLLEETADAAR